MSETRGRRHQRGLFRHQFQRHGDDPTVPSVQPMMMQETGRSEMTSYSEPTLDQSSLEACQYEHFQGGGGDMKWALHQNHLNRR